MTAQARIRRERRHKFMNRYAEPTRFDRRRRGPKMAEARMIWDRALAEQRKPK